MNTVKPKEQRTAARGLVIAGLVGLIFLIAWLSIQIINIAPSAFSSLASIADGISQYQETMVDEGDPLELAVVAGVIDSGDTTVLSWKVSPEAGTYSLSHSCVEGVKLSVLNEDGVRDIECGTNYNLGDVSEVTIIPTVETTEYVEVPYTITYSRLNETTAYRTGSATITTVNRDEESVPEEVVEETPTEEVDAVTTPAEETVGEELVYEFEYKIPVSDPNGNIDLATKFVSVGDIVDNRYVVGELQQNSTGAIQFEVKNIGTKTSEDWKFSITLPDGSTYNSDNQEPLKPNERATLIIGIQTIDDASHTFVGKLTTDEDSSSVNNTFSRNVKIQK